MTEESAPAAAAIRWQNAVVSAIAARTPRIKSFFFTLPEPFAFQAGQHVDIRLTAPDGYRAIRSYSIASAPDASGTIELAIERMTDGEVSPFFHDVVVPGDTIELRGPLGGYFVWPAIPAGALFFAAGGSGIVPLMSMIRYRQRSGDVRPIVLLYSARTENDVLFCDELLDLDARDDAFHLVLTLTREPPARPGIYGRRVDAALVRDAFARVPSTPAEAYVCGTNAFVNAAADGAVAAGIPAANVKTERYGG